MYLTLHHLQPLFLSLLTCSIINHHHHGSHHILIHSLYFTNHQPPRLTYSVTLTIRKIEQEILAQGHAVCILSTKSGDMKNTHMDGEHPNRTVIFIDNSFPIPFLHDPNHPENSYHLGFSLSSKVLSKIEVFEPTSDTCNGTRLYLFTFNPICTTKGITVNGNIPFKYT